MNIYGIGTDIVNIDRIKKIFRQRGDTFKNKVYTNFEISKCNKRKNKNEVLLKDLLLRKLFKAVSKSNQLQFKDVEIRNNKLGAPEFKIKGNSLKNLKKSLKIKNLKFTCLFLMINHGLLHRNNFLYNK